MPNNYAEFLEHLYGHESRGAGGYQAENRYGYLGRYQMGASALISAGYKDVMGAWTGRNGIYSASDFKNSPVAQEDAVRAYHAQAWREIKGLGFRQYVGRRINGVEITPYGLLAAYHLKGGGQRGATENRYQGLRHYLESDGKIDPTDGNGTPISRYMEEMAGYGDIPEAGIPTDNDADYQPPQNVFDSINDAVSSIGDGISDAFGLGEAEPEVSVRPQMLPSRSQQVEDIFRSFGGNLAASLLDESIDFVFDKVFGGGHSHTTRYETDRSRRAGSFPSRQQMRDDLMQEYQRALRNR